MRRPGPPMNDRPSAGLPKRFGALLVGAALVALCGIGLAVAAPLSEGAWQVTVAAEQNADRMGPLEYAVNSVIARHLNIPGME